MEFLKELGRKNIIDLTKLIHWNVQNKIFFLRMSSEIFPFASHPDLGYTLEYASEELKLAGDTAKRLGVRLTTHPGQFTQLGSPRESVLSNAARDLKYHCELMDRMGLDQDSGGGVYGDKAAAMERFRANFRLLPLNVRNRVVLENDEMCYNVDDLLPVCEELEIPLVLDYHHDWIYPSSQTPTEMMPRILATWKRGIKPKQHLSEPRFGAVTTMEKRAHSDRCQRLPEGLPDDMDLMIEAKDKEQAVLHLFRIYNLQPTIHESLRPPVLQETTQTAGRKSNKRKAASQAQPLIKTDDAEFVDEVEACMSLVIEDTRTDIDSPISGKGVRIVREGGRSIPEVNGHTLFLQPFESNPNVESVEVLLKGVESRRRRNLLLQSIYGREQLWLQTSAKVKVKHSGWFGKSTKTSMPVFVVQE
ncbi:hypothetical protein RQP46_001411 [Phenoliferia psychrophenolica]